jgi:hypothetical protein
LIKTDEIDELLPLTDPAVHRLLGVAGYTDPYQAAGRIIRARQAPHLKIGRRIRVSLPALRQWAAEQIAQSVPARDDAQ